MRKIKLQDTIKSVLIIGFVVILSACGSKRASVSSSGTLDIKSQNELVSDILDNDLKYTTISGKMNLEILPANSKKGMKTGTFVKLIRDSIIQISIRPVLGMEVFRVSITPDSLYVLDRMNKKYAIENINDFRQSQGAYFNYYNLQALLTNSLFLPGKQSVENKDYSLFDISTTSDMYLMKTIDESGMLYNFAIDSSDKIASTLILSPKKNYTLQWSYSDFIKDADYVYPTQILANVDINKKRFDLKISYTKLDFDKKLDIDNSVSSKYDKVSISDMLRTLMKIK